MPNRHDIFQALVTSLETEASFTLREFLKGQISTATRVIPDKRRGNKAYNFSSKELDMIYDELNRSFSRPMGLHRKFGLTTDLIKRARTSTPR